MLATSVSHLGPIDVGDPHQQGHLGLRFRCDARNRTVIDTRSQRFPLRFAVPMYLDASDPGMAFIYVQNPTGAVLAGDRLSLDFELDREARVHVTTPSATKLHSMPEGCAEQQTHVRVADNAYFESFSDALIPHATADYRQNTVVDLAESAAYVGCDVVASGRIASGERFAYRRLGLETLVRVDGRPVYADRLDLEPGQRSPVAAGIMGGYDYLVTVLGVAPGLDDHERLGSELHAELCALGLGLPGAGALPSGVGLLVRALAPDRVAAYQIATAAWTSLRRSFRGLDRVERRM